MSTPWKKILSLILSLLMLLSCFTGCQNTKTPPADTTQTAVTQKNEPVKVKKVLTLGHSLTVDSCHMLAMVAAAEGYDELMVGTLYYSGCPLFRHVEHLQTDAREYSLYISNTSTPNQPPEITNNVTMKEALRLQDWDLIVMQGGTFEVAQDDTYTNGNIQTIQKFVNENKLNPNAIFAWHMPWAFATEKELMNSFPNEKNPYTEGYLAYNYDRVKFYEAFAQCVSTHILTDDTFRFVIPSGTAMENAMSSYLTEFDLIRDYAHATDFGRLIAAYTWYCMLAGVDHLEEIKLDAIPKSMFRTTTDITDRVLTDTEKAILLESVNNALANPLQLTQSQYTEAPAA